MAKKKKIKSVKSVDAEGVEDNSADVFADVDESAEEWVDEDEPKAKKEKVKKVSKPKGKAKSPSRYAKFQGDE